MKNKKIPTVLVLIGTVLNFLALWLMISNRADGNLTGVLFGIGSGLIGVGISKIFEKAVYRKRPELYKKVTIEQNDERNIAIKNKAQAKAGTILMYLNFILVIVMVACKIPLWAILSLVSINLIYSFCVVFFINKFNNLG